AGATVSANESDAAQEQAAFNAALNRFRNADYAGAQTALRAYLQRYPQGSNRIDAQHWLGNTEYALRNYSSAITNFRNVVTQAPRHRRAPEALLSIAASQMELKDTAAARKTLEQLITTYPRSEAAQAAQDRLARLR
ncbi:MAG: tol-pal system protein YbgF, partial [Brachymonas sp.]|nr:tol-pal system protein YbgF [Brachymonas sp.]